MGYEDQSIPGDEGREMSSEEENGVDLLSISWRKK
jgi:hypothetical protein